MFSSNLLCCQQCSLLPCLVNKCGCVYMVGLSRWRVHHGKSSWQWLSPPSWGGLIEQMSTGANGVFEALLALHTITSQTLVMVKTNNAMKTHQNLIEGRWDYIQDSSNKFNPTWTGRYWWPNSPRVQSKVQLDFLNNQTSLSNEVNPHHHEDQEDKSQSTFKEKIDADTHSWTLQGSHHHHSAMMGREVEGVVF